MRFFLLLYAAWQVATVLCWGVPPAAPSNLILTAPAPTSLKLDWTDNATNETSFEISYRVGTSGAFLVLSGAGVVPAANSTTQSLTGGSSFTVWQFRIRAVVSTGPEFSDYSNIATVMQPGYRITKVGTPLPTTSI